MLERCHFLLSAVSTLLAVACNEQPGYSLVEEAPQDCTAPLFLQLPNISLGLAPKHQLAAKTSSKQQEAFLQISSALGALSSLIEDQESWLTILMVVCILLCFVTAVSYVFLGSDPLSEAVRHGIDEVAPKALGIDVNIEHMEVSTFRGWVDIRGLTLYNPPGYTGPYLLQARRIYVDLDTQKLLGSCCNFQHVTVSQIDIDGVDLLIESKGFGFNATTNVEELTESLGKPDTSQQPDASLQIVDVKNVRALLRSDQLGGASMTIDVADLHYTDFSKQMGVHCGADIVKLIVQTLLKTAHEHATAGIQSLPRLGQKSCC